MVKERKKLGRKKRFGLRPGTLRSNPRPHIPIILLPRMDPETLSIPGDDSESRLPRYFTILLTAYENNPMSLASGSKHGSAC